MADKDTKPKVRIGQIMRKPPKMSLVSGEMGQTENRAY